MTKYFCYRKHPERFIGRQGKAIGIELENKYCNIAIERLRQSTMPLNL